MLKKKTNELSASIEQDFRPDLITQCGFSGNITAMAYDPVQSLYAIGLDTGFVQVMGGGEVRCVLDPNPARKGPTVPILHLRFVTSVYLVSIDDRSMIVVWALDTRTEWCRYQSPFSVLSCWTDPSLDWLFLGHMNGESTVFDIDRGRPTPYKIANLEKIVDPKCSMGAVIALSMHPRDPALLLLCYRDVAAVWNLAKNEIVFDLHYEFPLTYAVWHPSGSHIATSHVNGYVVFWDGGKGVRLGARSAFAADLEKMDLNSNRMPERLAWCCREDPIDTFLLVWGGRSLSIIEFGYTPTVATTSYDSMGNFYKSAEAPQRELTLNTDIKLAQLIPAAGNPHFQGGYNASHIVLQLASQQTLVVALPALYVVALDATVLPPALCWRASPITYLGETGITRNQWIGMMAAAQPNTKVVGGSSASQQIRKQQLATVLCMGCANGSVRLFDATRADSRDYRVLMTSVANIDKERPIECITRVSLGREVGEMSIATESGTLFMASFGKNKRLQQPGPPAPQPEIVNIEHLVVPELFQGYIPQWMMRGNAPITALCNSNIGFVAAGYADGRLVVIDKRGPAVIFDQAVKGTATCLNFGIMAVGTEGFSSILLGVGTSTGTILCYRVVPRQQGGYTVSATPKDTISLNLGSDPVATLAFIDTREGKSAEALPDTMSRLASGILIQGAILATSIEDARFFTITGPKAGKKAGSKSYDTPLLGSSYAFLRWGSSSALVSVNFKGKVGIYGLPSLSTLTSYNIPIIPQGLVLISEMGDAFLPYDRDLHAGQVIRIFGTDQFPKDDELWQLKRRVPARPAISTAHWIAGRQYVKPSDLDNIIGGKRRGKSKRVRSQLVDENGVVEPEKTDKDPGGPKGWASKAVPNFVHPKPQRVQPPQKTWGQTITHYYESAEDTVNAALDDAMESIGSGKSQAQSSAMKGIIGSKLGF